MEMFGDYRRSEFAMQVFIVSWLLSLLPVAAFAIYMLTHPTRDSIVGLGLVLLQLWIVGVIIVNFAAVIYWLGDRLPGGFPRLAVIMWPVALLSSLWYFSDDSVSNLLRFLLFDYALPVVLATLGMMTAFIVVVRLTLWVVAGFKVEPRETDHGVE
jgi:hypothetical protein